MITLAGKGPRLSAPARADHREADGARQVQPELSMASIAVGRVDGWARRGVASARSYASVATRRSIDSRAPSTAGGLHPTPIGAGPTPTTSPCRHPLDHSAHPVTTTPCPPRYRSGPGLRVAARAASRRAASGDAPPALPPLDRALFHPLTMGLGNCHFPLTSTQVKGKWHGRFHPRHRGGWRTSSAPGGRSNEAGQCLSQRAPERYRTTSRCDGGPRASTRIGDGVHRGGDGWERRVQ